MRIRGGNRGASAAANAFTVVMMAAVTIAQLLSISHEITVRHFRCSEHGELTHAATVEVAAIPAQRANHALRSQEDQTPDTHEHCGVAFTIEGSSCTPSSGGTIGTVTPELVQPPMLAVAAIGRRPDILASAPKTSPPSA